MSLTPATGDGAHNLASAVLRLWCGERGHLLRLRGARLTTSLTTGARTVVFLFWVFEAYLAFLFRVCCACRVRSAPGALLSSWRLTISLTTGALLSIWAACAVLRLRSASLVRAGFEVVVSGGGGLGFRAFEFTLFRGLGSGFRVSGFGFRVSGFEFRVSGFGFRVLGFGFPVSGFGFRGSGLGTRGTLAGGGLAGDEIGPGLCATQGAGSW